MSPGAHSYLQSDTQTSMSKDLYLVSFDDMCLFGPPDPFARVSETDGNVVAWCTKVSKHATPTRYPLSIDACGCWE